MASYLVYSGGDGTGGTAAGGWSAAYQSLTACLTAATRTNADTIYVAHDNNETPTSGAMTLTFPTTPGLRVLCVTRVGTGAYTPAPGDVVSSPSGIVANTGTGAILTLVGHAWIEGIVFNVASGSTGNPAFTVGSTTVAVGITLKNCKIVPVATAAGFIFNWGATSTAVLEQRVRLIDTPVKFSATGQGMKVHSGRHSWSGALSGVDAAGTIPTLLILANTVKGGGMFTAKGIDLSAMGSGKTIISLAQGPIEFEFSSLKLGASVTKTTGTHGGPGGPRIRFHLCNSGAVNNGVEEYDYAGSMVNEVTIVRTGTGTNGFGGASNGTDAQSWKVTTNANASLVEPFGVPLFSEWFDGAGAAKTVTVDVVTDGVTLNDDEIWVEVEYLGSSLTPISTTASDKKTDILAAGVAQTASTIAWTTSGLSSPVKQKLEVTFTPNMKGYFKVAVKVAKASLSAVYIDPRPQVA